MVTSLGLFEQIRMNKHPMWNCVWAKERKKGVSRKIHHSYRDNTKDTFIRFPRTFICIGYSIRSPSKPKKKRIQEKRSQATFIFSSLRSETGINFMQRIEWNLYVSLNLGKLLINTMLKCPNIQQKALNNFNGIHFIKDNELLLGCLALNRFIPLPSNAMRLLQINVIYCQAHDFFLLSHRKHSI